MKMARIQCIFERLEKNTQKEGQSEFVQALTSDLVKDTENEEPKSYHLLRTFLLKIFSAIDELSAEILNDDSILISVKNQKILRTCFQLVTSLGISNCLIPGLGVSLTQRCSSAILPKLNFIDEDKYELLVDCTNFFTRSYKVPVLKKIILTLHLSDYLASLIQLSFAPLKKPGSYGNFVMTKELYHKLNDDRKQFKAVYENLVTNCFQPILMKELLVLQGVKPSPPAFVKRVISKEMSARLLTPGGLLSLIRCFIESYDIDTGLEWKKIDMICRLVTTTHGVPENEYLNNISSQLAQIFSLNNTHYLATAVACVTSLNEKYPDSQPTKKMVNDIFQTFDYNYLKLKPNCPGAVIVSAQEVIRKVNILHACVCSGKLKWPVHLLTPNLYVLLMIGAKCTRHEDLQVKLKDILLKCLQKLSKPELTVFMRYELFNQTSKHPITVEELDSGLAIKHSLESEENEYGSTEITYFGELFKSSTENDFVKAAFEASLDKLINITDKINPELGHTDGRFLQIQYEIILLLLSDMANSPKTVTELKNDPSIVMNFIEHFVAKQSCTKIDNECSQVACSLLTVILTNSNRDEDLERRLVKLIPELKRKKDTMEQYHHNLYDDVLMLIERGVPLESACNKAIRDTFDELLPVRAHGLMALTRLLDDNDSETMKKQHYVFVIFQEHLKDPDSYIYLAAINGLVALGHHMSDDVLQLLCKEFLQLSNDSLQTRHDDNSSAEMRMKVGEVIVKVTKRLGEENKLFPHKTLLLNTMMSASRDHDPLIRTSALSNLAEIARVLHYKIGSIIYEVLLCVWITIESDKAVECRRAAVMVISSLLKGLGNDTLVQLKENLLPIYRTLKTLYKNEDEDSIVRLHAQIALEELNDIVKQFLFPEVEMQRNLSLLQM